MAGRYDVILPVLFLLIGLIFLAAPELTNEREKEARPEVLKAVVLLKELCYQPLLNISRIKELAGEFLNTSNRTEVDLQIEVLPESVACDASHGLVPLLDTLSNPATSALIGSFDSDMCDVAVKVATLRNKQLFTWSCPQTSTNNNNNNFARLGPSLTSSAEALVHVIKHFRWKTAAIVTTDWSFWPQLAHALDVTLRAEGVVVKHHVIVQMSPFGRPHSLARSLWPLHQSPSRVIILCLPLRSSLTFDLLRSIETLNLTRSPATTLVAIHLSSVITFLPPATATNHSARHSPPAVGRKPKGGEDGSTTTTPEPATVITARDERGEEKLKGDFSRSNREARGSLEVKSDLGVGQILDSKVNGTNKREMERHDTRVVRSFPDVLAESMAEDHLWESYGNVSDALLVLTSVDPVFKVADLLNVGVASYGVNEEIWVKVRLALGLLADANKSSSDCAAGKLRFLLLDRVGNATSATRWRPLLQLDSGNGSGFVLKSLVSNLQDWGKNRLKTGTQNNADMDGGSCFNGECDNDVTDSNEVLSKGANIATIVICSALLATGIVALGVLARRQVLRKRMFKGPYKILLTPTDFVFPQVPDTLRVDEGMEAMLCCWLQQLQEFGGPEVDKPDLIKGSLGSLKSLRSHQQMKLTGSNSSLARNIIIPKARYNGDLVQMKEIPTPSQGFELRHKAMAVLTTMHGLRHENVNPFLGVLVTSHPALVLEWCSRGSLEDVLVQDEIKLDWSFRLSLLTDLVRGMRYLHTCPLRVHGNLTSRNCVIDARWVLKITDYGLPAFYEAQNISPPCKTARGKPRTFHTAASLYLPPCKRSTLAL